MINLSSEAKRRGEGLQNSLSVPQLLNRIVATLTDALIKMDICSRVDTYFLFFLSICSVANESVCRDNALAL